jgi:N-acetylglucosamine-6-sulfatase
MFSLASAVETALVCRGAALVAGGGSCVPDPPPACAATEPQEIVDLIFGGAPTAIASIGTPAGRCQVALAQAAGRYARERAAGLVRGRRRTTRARLVKRVVRDCTGVAVDALPTGRLPGVGEPCASAAIVTAVDAARLASCVSARLEAVIGDAWATPIPPNIVVVLTDDQPPSTLEFMPATLAEIAGRGVRFENAFVSSAACTPSRATILSGRYAHNHGITDNAGLLLGGHQFDHENTVAAWLRQASYRTGMFGHYMLFASVLGESKPVAWDAWWTLMRHDEQSFTMSINGPWRDFGSGQYLTDFIARNASRFIAKNREKPFFVVVAPTAPHEPAIPAARHQNLFLDLPPWRPPNFREPDTTGKPQWVQYSRAIAATSTDAVDELRIRMAQSLQAVDEAVLGISDLLDDLGLSDRTLVLYLSDNGVHLQEHWWGSKFDSYEEGIRVPLLLRYPVRYPTARVDTSLASNVDIAATIVDASGAAAPALDGTSLLETLDGAVSPRADLLVENFTSYIIVPNRAVRTERWKYIRTDAPVGVTEELYDLEADPFELVNKAADPALQTVKQTLADRLAVLQQE